MPWVSPNDTDANEQRVRWQDLKHLKALWPYVRPQKKRLIWAFALLPLVSLSQLALPWLVRLTIDGPIQHKDWNGLIVNACVFLAIIAFHYTCKYYHLVITQVAGQHIIHALRCAIYNHLQTLSSSFFTKTPVGKIVTRVTADTENVNEIFASGCIGLFTDTAVIGGILVAMGFLEWRLAIIVLAICPFLILSVELIRRESRKAYNAIRGKLSDINIILQESVVGVEVIQMLQREQAREADFIEKCKAYRKSNLRAVVTDSSMTATIEVFSYVSYISVIVGFIWSQGTANPISFGVLIGFLYYVQMLYEPIEQLSDKFTFIQSGLASIEKIMELMSEAPEIQERSQNVSKAPVQGEIVFDNVSFSYTPETPVLQGLSFTVNPGEKVALVGRTGAGKSTIIKLLARQYDITGGDIRLDGQPIQNLPIQSLRRSLVVIPQEDFLFSRSVRENITLTFSSGGSQKSLEAHDIDTKIWSTLKRVHADTIVSQLPEGLDTILPERGKALSNGERQLLVFARALWHDPRVLILDEATSAIDPKTEALVQDALEETLKGRTAIIIAHRLSTIQNVDRIIHLENGQVAHVSHPQHSEQFSNSGLFS
jgi:ATP-binding cassette, subfamily B, multidrug efflux pump